MVDNPTTQGDLPTRLRAYAADWWERAASKDIVEEAATEIERLRGVLRHIAVMDVYTRDGEEPIHELMRRLAWEAINNGSK